MMYGACRVIRGGVGSESKVYTVIFWQRRGARDADAQLVDNVDNAMKR